VDHAAVQVHCGAGLAAISGLVARLPINLRQRGVIIAAAGIQLDRAAGTRQGLFEGAGLQVAILVVGTGLSGSIYVVCPPMLSEFTPVSQRGAVISIYGALYTLAGILAPSVMGKVIQNAGGLLEGYVTGYTINAVILIGSGLLGLLLLWPNTERARLVAQAAAQPKFA